MVDARAEVSTQAGSPTLHAAEQPRQASEHKVSLEEQLTDLQLDLQKKVWQWS